MPFARQEVSRALSLAGAKTGNSIVARIAIIVIETKTSIKVKARIILAFIVSLLF
jgi:hypothetical protein